MGQGRLYRGQLGEIEKEKMAPYGAQQSDNGKTPIERGAGNKNLVSLGSAEGCNGRGMRPNRNDRGGNTKDGGGKQKNKGTT